MKQIVSGITGSALADNAQQKPTGLQPGATGSDVRTVPNRMLAHNAAIVDGCLKRLNASRRRATAQDWTPEDMRKPEFLRPTWALDGDPARLKAALSLTCTLSEAAEAMRELVAMTHMAASRQDDPEDTIERFTRRLTAYPPLVVLEVVSDWTVNEEFFPRAWVLLKDRLDLVRMSLEALAK